VTALRVGYDVTATIVGRTGVARYARELVAAVEEEGVAGRLLAVGRGPYPPPAGTRRVRVPLRVVRAGWSVLHGPRVERWLGEIDLMHALDMSPPPTRRPLAITVHDLAALEHPHLHSSRHVDQQRRQLRAALSARLLCAVSHSTADALTRHGIPSERIAVTPLGLTRLPPPEPPSVRPPFLLAVGELASRKSLGTLIDAFRTADLPAEWRLVLAGPPGHGADAVLSRTGERVLALGAVSDAQLAGLYRAAAALCFPSAAEGFGLPVLEAMSYGLPVVASDLPVTREVAAEDATFVAAGDVQGWRRALEDIVAHPTSPAQLERARLRASAYTWQRTAQLTVAAYRRALSCE
jgi:glycosyltransferase involved in cell wall biosynthesis